MKTGQFWGASPREPVALPAAPASATGAASPAVQSAALDSLKDAPRRQSSATGRQPSCGGATLQKLAMVFSRRASHENMPPPTLPQEQNVAPTRERRWERQSPKIQLPVFEKLPKISINAWPSEPEIKLTGEPDKHITELSEKDRHALTRALGWEPLSGTPTQDLDVRLALHDFGMDVRDNFPSHELEPPADAALHALPDSDLTQLKEAMNQAGMVMAAQTGSDGVVRLRLFFYGSDKASDMKHHLWNGLGRTSDVDHAARDIGVLLARQLANKSNYVKIDRIAGASMGGAAAQICLAALQCRVQLAEPPTMLLWDPQLLNEQQARLATEGARYDVNFAMPRGVAISLDYAKAPVSG